MYVCVSLCVYMCFVRAKFLSVAAAAAAHFVLISFLFTFSSHRSGFPTTGTGNELAKPKQSVVLVAAAEHCIAFLRLPFNILF